MYTILLIMTINLNNSININYQYEGTMEDCMSVIKSYIYRNTVNKEERTIHYFCVPVVDNSTTL